MNLSLSSEIQRLIEARVKSGQYHSAEEVVTAALLTLDQQERVANLAATGLDRLYPDFRAKLDAGLAAAHSGQFVDGEDLFDTMEREEQAKKGRKTA